MSNESFSYHLLAIYLLLLCPAVSNIEMSIELWWDKNFDSQLESPKNLIIPINKTTCGVEIIFNWQRKKGKGNWQQKVAFGLISQELVDAWRATGDKHLLLISVPEETLNQLSVLESDWRGSNRMRAVESISCWIKCWERFP